MLSYFNRARGAAWRFILPPALSWAHAHRRGRWLPAAALALALPAVAQPTDVFGPATARLGLSEAQLQAVYSEALAVHDGQAYAVDFIIRPTCEELAPFAEPQKARMPLSLQLRGEAVRQIRRYQARPLFALPPELREAVRPLLARQHSEPFRLADGTCMIGDVVELRPLPMPAYERLRDQLSFIVEQGWLPHPDRLASDPMLRRRRMADAIVSAERLAEAPIDFDVDQRLANGSTLLVRALLLGRFDLARALIARKANPNLCAPRFCAIEMLLHQPAGEPAARMLAELLAAGADPNQVGQGRNIHPPLTIAAGSGNLAAMQALIAAGARIDGVAGRVPPLVMAAGTRKIEAFELLLARGADIWVRDDTALLIGTVYAAAIQAAPDDTFVRDVERRMLAAAEKSGRFKWQGWVEQDGRRQSIVSGDLVLRRAPFRMVFRVDGEVGMLVASADTDVLQNATRAGNYDTIVMRHGAVGADSPDGDDLFVNQAAGNPNPLDNGVHQIWFWESESVRRYSSRRPVSGGYEYVREVRGVLLDSVTKPLSAYPGRALHLVVAVPIALAFNVQRLESPAYVTLRFAD